MTEHNNGTTLEQLAVIVGGSVGGDGNIVICGVAPIEDSGDGMISFLSNSKYEHYLDSTKASALIVHSSVSSDRLNLIKVEDPYNAFRIILEYFYPFYTVKEHSVHSKAHIHPDAVIAEPVEIDVFAVIERASIGANSYIGAHSYIGNDVVLGENAYLHPRTIIMDGVIIGNNVTIHPGAIIGSDGFGYAKVAGKYNKIPQVGTVVIGNNVEIGAGCTIDRGTLNNTVIGDGCILDNLVQIAHNVTIGENTAIAAQSGIAGSSSVGMNVTIAGQVGVVGHLTIGDNAILGGKAGVTKSVPENTFVFGYPAREHLLHKKIEASMKRLPELIKKVRRLEKK